MTHDERETKVPDEPGRDVIAPGADAVEPRDSATEPVPSRRWKAFLYAIPAVLFVALGIAWMFSTEPILGGGGDSSEVRGTTGHDPEGGRPRGEVLNESPEGPAVISDVELLTKADEYAGRPARFAAINVAARNGERTFWVGRLGNRTLVLLDRTVQNIQAIRPGKAVSIAGRIERKPSAEQIDRLGLKDEDRRALEGEDVYIRATEVTIPEEDVGTPVTETPREDRESDPGPN
jgi:hypothetical protein